jgi:dihydrodipicolinate synthase/N-acetylneuraminate lyase
MITVKEAKEKMNGVVIPLATIFKDDLTVDVDATQKKCPVDY